MLSKTKISGDHWIREEISSRWPKVSIPELNRIIVRHSELREVLKTKYSMSKEEAHQTTAAFFEFFNSYKLSKGKDF